MFHLGYQEMAVIAVLALVIFGPERLPEVARAAGRLFKLARRATEKAKRELEEVMHSIENPPAEKPPASSDSRRDRP